MEHRIRKRNHRDAGRSDGRLYDATVDWAGMAFSGLPVRDRRAGNRRSDVGVRMALGGVAVRVAADANAARVECHATSVGVSDLGLGRCLVLWPPVAGAFEFVVIERDNTSGRFGRLVDSHREATTKNWFAT